jgi:hypothetical protein
MYGCFRFEASMELNDLDNMTEAQINAAAREAEAKADTGDTAAWGELCGLVMVNYPNLTDKQKILRDALSREGRHGRGIKTVARTARTDRMYRSRPSGG